jgi:lysine-ketoglutarate reductase/saccharopine dehydrogenase-like protein (TIGR00300 family)
VKDMAAAKAAGRRVILVSGPVAVHTGGVTALEQLLSAGAIDAILAGNALAVHDIERALFNTSLGIDADTGEAVQDGHRNHMRAINAIRAAGGIRKAVENGILTRGIMHRAVVEGVPFVLAGSLRDDGPLPEVVTDMNRAQEAYGEMLAGAGVVLILSTMLHGIAVGNMIPSSVLTVCVDINPAVATKLADRGSSQAIGVVTDVGAFLSMLARHFLPDAR